MHGDVVVEHHINMRNVESTTGNIGGHQDGAALSLKLGQCTQTLRLERSVFQCVQQDYAQEQWGSGEVVRTASVGTMEESTHLSHFAMQAHCVQPQITQHQRQAASKPTERNKKYLDS